VRLKDMSQVVLAGRQELGRFQVQEPTVLESAPSQDSQQLGGRARRAAGRLRRATRNLAS